jgi:hypothetical protein
MSRKIHSIKAKLASKLETSAEDKERLKRACSTAVSALETTLKIIKEAAGDAGPPGLQTGIGGLLFVLDVIKVKPSLSHFFSPAEDQVENLPKCAVRRTACDSH